MGIIAESTMASTGLIDVHSYHDNGSFDMASTAMHRLISPNSNISVAETAIHVDAKMAFALLKFCLPVILLLGTVGNVLSFAVLIRRSMRSTPMYFYLMLLAVADTMVLYTSAFKTWIRVMTGYEALHVSDVGCKLITFLLLNSLYMSAWLIVLVTLDRFFVVWFPFRGYLMMRTKRAQVIAIALTIIVGLYNSHVFWTFSLSRSADDGEEANEVPPKCESTDTFFMHHVFEYLKLASYCAVPFAIVLALNVSIIIKINGALSPTPVNNARSTARLILTINPATSLPPAPLPTQTPPTCVPMDEVVVFEAGGRTALRGGTKRRRTLPRVQYFKFNRLHQRQHDHHHHHQPGHNINTMLSTGNTSVSSNHESGKTTSCMTAHAPVADKSFNASMSVQENRRQRQRRLTHMLLFISFTWLILTAPFTLYSFMVEPAPAPAINQSDFINAEHQTSVQFQTNQSYIPTVIEQDSLLHRNGLPIISPKNQSEDFVNSARWNNSHFEFFTPILFETPHESGRGLSNNDSFPRRVQSIKTTKLTSGAGQMNNQTGDTHNDKPRMFLIKTICFLFVYINHASNFYLYCVTGAKFRYELRAMLMSWCRFVRRLASCHICHDLDRRPSVPTASNVVPVIDSAISIGIVQCVDMVGSHGNAGGNCDRVSGPKSSSSQSSGSSRATQLVINSRELNKIARNNINELYN